jgi:uncharacterized protein with von Willebrand factor type A (vWA) domain
LKKLCSDTRKGLSQSVMSSKKRLEKRVNVFKLTERILRLSLMLRENSAKNLRQNCRRKLLMLKEKRLFCY